MDAMVASDNRNMAITAVKIGFIMEAAPQDKYMQSARQRSGRQILREESN
jgi:hypothetical protein